MAASRTSEKPFASLAACAQPRRQRGSISLALHWLSQLRRSAASHRFIESQWADDSHRLLANSQHFAGATARVNLPASLSAVQTTLLPWATRQGRNFLLNFFKRQYFASQVALHMVRHVPAQKKPWRAPAPRACGLFVPRSAPPPRQAGAWRAAQTTATPVTPPRHSRAGRAVRHLRSRVGRRWLRGRLSVDDERHVRHMGRVKVRGTKPALREQVPQSRQRGLLVD